MLYSFAALRLDLDDWTNIATIFAALAGGAALVYTAVQVHLGTRVSRAQFWLELRKMFGEHHKVHLRLRSGKWPRDDPAPLAPEDWAELESYMGLFEHCEIMLQEGLLDWRTFRRIYSYRLRLILRYPLIVREKLIMWRSGWDDFVALLQRMEPDPLLVRYVYGFWSPEREKGFLWWGTPAREEGARRFDDWDRLETDYHRLLASLAEAGTPAEHAWLRRNDETLHRLSAGALQGPGGMPLPEATRPRGGVGG